MVSEKLQNIIDNYREYNTESEDIKLKAFALDIINYTEDKIYKLLGIKE